MPNQLPPFALINPQLCKKLDMRVELVQSGEDPVPHIHVYFGEQKKCSCIRLDKAAYAPCHETVPFTAEQKAKFICLMNAMWDRRFIQSVYTEKIRPATSYEGAVVTWLDTFEETARFSYDEAGFPIMPDYEKDLQDEGCN